MKSDGRRDKRKVNTIQEQKWEKYDSWGEWEVTRRRRQGGTERGRQRFCDESSSVKSRSPPTPRGRRPPKSALSPLPFLLRQLRQDLEGPDCSQRGGLFLSSQNRGQNFIDDPRVCGIRGISDPLGEPEKKKKGKRRYQELAVQEGAESDDTTSMSALNMGGEDSQDPLDNAKRRSGRQVKRRKYNEDLDFKVVDDDGETIAVLGAGRISALNATALAWQAEEPPEDEANIIEKILSVRTVKKETSSSEDQAEETEEFYVKYRNL
ncbi:chromodomain-helicase-DNA-binding protein 6 [Lates japonicus]|uniref:Chromodomain-helicase-DNA-binding protein 6 n=1 Tax=Lates japonicus TaxID=270547 RepID=A0AAD3N295_LATJO|nr:chromodomain-helicase-DNA-binding protein 6 [Lates japonicus]